jgi:hypothetical protein
MAAQAALIALLATVLATAPAAAARDRCPRTAAGAPLSARMAGRAAHGMYRTAVVACDRRRGRERVLRRATVTARPPSRGREVLDISVAAGRVAWLEAIYGASRRAAAVSVADARTGRLVQRRFVLARSTTGGRVYGGVALATRGELAWNVGLTPGDAQLVLALPGSPPRELARGRLTGIVQGDEGLALEDDGTLLWTQGNDVVSLDLPGRDFGAGCPKRRSRYAPAGASGGIVYTVEHRRGAFTISHIWRACDPATGADVIVDAGYSYIEEGGGPYVEIAGGGNGWAATTSRSIFKYELCGPDRLRTIHVATGRIGREATQRGCDAVPYGRETQVTTLGAPVWLTREAHPRLMTVDGDGRVAELDRGAIADVRVEGDEVAWTNAGEPRRARP